MTIQNKSSCSNFGSLIITAIFILIFFGFGIHKASAIQLRGSTSVEALLFPEESIHPGQEDHAVSWVARPEFYHSFDDGSLFTFLPHFRLDSADNERTHFDIRDLSFILAKDDYDFKVGVRQVFWGVAESIRLVDIVNQTDLVDSSGGDQKLGQPMVNLTLYKDWGILDIFILPYFRERTFPGRGGRFRPSLLVDTDQEEFESSAKNWHTDLAFRYFQNFQDFDFAVSQFIGTSRDPQFNLGVRDDGELFLKPFYPQIEQTGLELSYIIGRGILKFEGIRRSGFGEDYYASAQGFEYTFSGIGGTGMDVTLFAEYLYDHRGEKMAVFDNDVSFTVSWVLNDIPSTAFVAGITQDIGGPAKFIFAQASRRLTRNISTSLVFQTFLDQPNDDLIFDLRDDDSFRFEMTYNF